MRLDESLKLSETLNVTMIPGKKLCVRCKIQMFETLRNFDENKVEEEETKYTGPGFDSPDIELKRIEKKFTKQVHLATSNAPLELELFNSALVSKSPRYFKDKSF